MVERIRQLLETRQLTPTQFADAIGVARPIISHILSGRNKPSLEVVQKIIGAFPDLSLSWLLSGTGEMVAAIPLPNTTALKDQALPFSSDKAARDANKARKASEVATEALRAPEEPITPLFSSPSQLVEPVVAPRPDNLVVANVQSAPVVPPAQVAPAIVAPPIATTADLSEPGPMPQGPSKGVVASKPDSAALAFAEPNKAIRRIVIFYQDGTFTDYRPEAS
ncbi:helix-turn-helix domain-containing protein [Hymenobacter crusticola]|uniref:HTH cro/C1-type domain-containing protein n=1 Tax=Hymenobacter crusticola TaxID=1770526 RepID=A0A243W8T2_9BACT|nr:helix-turn-helix transcriptional regulator [Hymenobacter crusticola]OUJ71789.1 hypothetical protein BXP70_20775 [Hymenobacter crusticola]